MATTISRAEVALRGRDETAAAFRSVIRNAEAAQKNITSKLRGAFNFLGAGTALFGFLRATTGSIRAGDDLAKFAEKSGLAARAASELAHAAKMADVDLGSFSVGVRNMQRALSEADSGNKSAQATFRALGLEWTKLRQLSPDRQIEAIADQLTQLQDPADRARAATELFGRAGADLLPLFLQGAAGIRAAREEAQQLGKSFSEADLKRFQEADQAIKRMRASFDALGSSAGLAVSGPLTRASDSLRSLFGGTTEEERLVENLRSAERAVQSFGKMINESPEGTRALENYAKALTALTDFRIERTIAQTRGLGSVTPAPGFRDAEVDKAEEKIRGVIEALKQQAATYKQGEAATINYRIAHGDLATALATLGDRAGPLRAELKALAGELAAAAKAAETTKAREEVQKLIAGLEQEIATFERGEVAAFRYRIQHGDLAATFAKLGAEAGPLRDKLIDLAETQQAIAESAKLIAERESRAAEIVAATRTDWEKLQQAIQETRRLAAEGFIDPDTEARNIQRLVKEYEEATNKISEHWLEAQRGIQRSLAGLFRNIGDGGARDFLKNVLGTIQDTLANRAAAMSMDSLGIGEKSKGGWLGRLLGIGGQAEARTPAQHRAAQIVDQIKASSGGLGAARGVKDPCACFHGATDDLGEMLGGAINRQTSDQKGHGDSAADKVVSGVGHSVDGAANSINANARMVGTRLADTLWAIKSSNSKSDLLTAAFGFFSSLGNSGGSTGTSGFARGGFLRPGQLGIVGEEGPEFAFGGRAGATIIPLPKSGRGGDGNPVVFNYNPVTNVDARGASVELANRLPAILAENSRRAVEQAKVEIVDGLRRRKYDIG